MLILASERRLINKSIIIVQTKYDHMVKLGVQGSTECGNILSVLLSYCYKDASM